MNTINVDFSKYTEEIRPPNGVCCDAERKKYYCLRTERL